MASIVILVFFMRLTWFLLAFFWMLLPQKSNGQEDLQWQIQPDSIVPRSLQRTSFADTSQWLLAIRGLVGEWREDGYLEAGLEHLMEEKNQWIAHLHRGPRYTWSDIQVSGPEDYSLPSRLLRRPVAWSDLQRWQERIIRSLNNRGFPFAASRLELQTTRQQQLRATITIDPGTFHVFDTLLISGEVDVRTAYLQQRLQLLPGTPFDRSLLEDLPRRVRDLPFLDLRGDPTLQFEDGRTVVTLPLALKAASRFDFLIGVLPNSPTTDRLLITGDLEAEFRNAFGRGERIYASYERLRPETQELNLAFSYPYVLGLPFGLDTSFDLYRRDTTFLNVDANLGVQYELGNVWQLTASYTSQASNLLSVDTAAIVRAGQLPDQLDSRRSGFALGLHWNQLNDRFNPRSGWSLQARLAAGIRRIRGNNEILESRAGDLYESINRRSAQYQIDISLARFWPLGTRSTVKTGITLGWIENEEGVLRNDQYRLGGNRLLRGFDEEFFFATNYAIATLEYRLLLDQNAYIYVFGDYGRLEDTRATPGQTLAYPFGFGTGLTFGTQAGLFSLSVAVGGTDQQPVNFGAPKVHFGYLSLF